MKTILGYIKISLSKSLHVYRLTCFFCLRNQNRAWVYFSRHKCVLNCSLNEYGVLPSTLFSNPVFLRERSIYIMNVFPIDIRPHCHPDSILLDICPVLYLISLSSADTGHASVGLLSCDLMMDNLIANMFCIFLIETLLFSY